MAVHRTAIHYRDCASLTLYTRGNEPTAAGGGGREASEWQRSKKSRKSVSPKIFSGTATGELWVRCGFAERSADTGGFDAAIPQSASLTAPFTQGSLWRGGGEGDFFVPSQSKIKDF